MGKTPTKTQLRAFLIKAMSGYASQGLHYEVHIYRDMEHWRQDAGDLESIYGFMWWGDAKKHVAPGYVFDVYIYKYIGAVAEGKHRSRELICNEVITLPGGNDDGKVCTMDFADRLDRCFRNEGE